MKTLAITLVLAIVGVAATVYGANSDARLRRQLGDKRRESAGG